MIRTQLINKSIKIVILLKIKVLYHLLLILSKLINKKCLIIFILSYWISINFAQLISVKQAIIKRFKYDIFLHLNKAFLQDNLSKIQNTKGDEW